VLSLFTKKAAVGKASQTRRAKKGRFVPFAARKSFAFRTRVDGVAADSHTFGLIVCLLAPVLTLDATECLGG
jgi:hypothetical protein